MENLVPDKPETTFSGIALKFLKEGFDGNRKGTPGQRLMAEMLAEKKKDVSIVLTLDDLEPRSPDTVICLTPDPESGDVDKFYREGLVLFTSPQKLFDNQPVFVGADKDGLFFVVPRKDSFEAIKAAVKDAQAKKVGIFSKDEDFVGAIKDKGTIIYAATLVDRAKSGNIFEPTVDKNKPVELNLSISDKKKSCVEFFDLYKEIRGAKDSPIRELAGGLTSQTKTNREIEDIIAKARRKASEFAKTDVVMAEKHLIMADTIEFYLKMRNDVIDDPSRWTKKGALSRDDTLVLNKAAKGEIERSVETTRNQVRLRIDNVNKANDERRLSALRNAVIENRASHYLHLWAITAKKQP